MPLINRQGLTRCSHNRLFKHDALTKRIFRDYVSRYGFKRSEEGGATVKLV